VARDADLLLLPLHGSLSRAIARATVDGGHLRCIVGLGGTPRLTNRRNNDRRRWESADPITAFLLRTAAKDTVKVLANAAAPSGGRSA